MSEENGNEGQAYMEKTIVASFGKRLGSQRSC